VNARVSAVVAASAVVLAELASLVLVFRAFFPHGDLWSQVAQWVGDTYRDPGVFRVLILLAFGTCLLWFVRAGYSCARVMTEGAAGWPGQAALLILAAVIVPPAVILTRDWWHPLLLRAFAGSSGVPPPFLKYVPEYLTVCYMASLHTFLLYGEDKFRAMTDRWRIPEKTLHWFVFFGGWPGALLAQQVFRHKTAKLEFRFGFYVATVTHFLVLSYLCHRSMQPDMKATETNAALVIGSSIRC
jgi:uncharacterized membrane protein YsdA (DUF1294 family)